MIGDSVRARSLRAPSVSIITTYFGASRFIREAIESVFAQSYSGWELLLVDDGSTDGSREIATQMARRDSRVRCLEHPGRANRGATVSRNLALRQAVGEFIAILDADDVWLPDKLYEQCSILRANPDIGMVYGNALYWTGWEGLSAKPGYHRRVLRDQSEYLEMPVSLRYWLAGDLDSPCPSDVLFRRDVILKVGGFLELMTSEYQMYEDKALFAKTALVAPILVSGRCWTRYRIHSESCCAMTVKAGREREVRRFFLAWLHHYLLERGVEDRGVWASLRRAQRPFRHPLLHHLSRIVRHTAAWAK